MTTAEILPLAEAFLRCAAPFVATIAVALPVARRMGGEG